MSVCQSWEIICPYCGCEKVGVARDGKSTRQCAKCFSTWLPSKVCVPNETLSLCEHGLPVKFECPECYFGKFNKSEHTMTPDQLPPYAHGCPDPSAHLKQETITIKKALWDEMLDNSKRVRELCYTVFKEHKEKIENLENLMLELQMSINTHPKILEHDERINNY